VPPLLIFFQPKMKVTAFLLQHMPQVAGWLRQKTQAENQKQKIFDQPIKQEFVLVAGSRFELLISGL
jgi:hypothetical protein